MSYRAALGGGGGAGALKGNPKGSRSAAAATVRSWTLGLALATLALTGGGYYFLASAAAAPRSSAAAAASPHTLGAAFSQVSVCALRHFPRRSLAGRRSAAMRAAAAAANGCRRPCSL